MKAIQHLNRAIDIMSPQFGARKKKEPLKTVREVLTECIRLFKSDAFEEIQLAAKEILDHVGNLFTIFMYIDTTLIRKKKNLFPARTKTTLDLPDNEPLFINLLGNDSNILPGLEGLEKYTSVRAKCTHHAWKLKHYTLILQVYDKRQKEWINMDIEFIYDLETRVLQLDSLFYESGGPPEILQEAVNAWRRVGRRTTRLSKKMSSDFVGYGLVGLRLAILLQEQCGINTLKLTDASQRRLEITSGGNKGLEVNISHRMYALIQARPLFYLDNGFEPYIGDLHYNVRRHAYQQHTKNATLNQELKSRIDELSGATDYKKRGVNFLNAPVTWLFKIPPLVEIMQYHDGLSNDDNDRKRRFQEYMRSKYQKVFSVESRHNLLNNLDICNIDFRYKKQLWPAPLIKIEPKEEEEDEEAVFSHKFRQKDQLYDVDKNDHVKMDDWLRAVPDRITIE